jgi:hypothetical protein
MKDWFILRLAIVLVTILGRNRSLSPLRDLASWAGETTTDPFAEVANCYSYALGVRGVSLGPGHTARRLAVSLGQPDPAAGSLSHRGGVQALLDSLELDGNDRLGLGEVLRLARDARQGTIAVAYHGSRRNGFDYHFARLDRVGGWSHKPGAGPAQAIGLLRVLVLPGYRPVALLRVRAHPQLHRVEPSALLVDRPHPLAV